MENMDFDGFLADANKKAAEHAEIIDYARSLDTRIEQTLDDLRAPRIASRDPDTQEELMNLAVHEYEEMLQDHADRSGTPIDEDLLREYAQSLASEQLIRESAIFAKIKISIAVYDYQFKNGTVPDKATTDRNKKELTADVMIANKLEANDSMVILINTLVPGESLNTSSRDDDVYMLNAIERHANKVEQEKKTAELTDKAIEILRNAGEYTNNRLATFTRLAAVAVIRSEGEQADIMRQAEYDEIIRDNNLSMSLAHELIELINQYYPLPKNN